jgi:hypothetical protein
MIGRDSRYANAPRAEIDSAEGRRTAYVVPPILPAPDSYEVARLVPLRDHDRSDLLAAQAYGDPLAWWLIANANPVIHPDDLDDAAGDTIVLPVPGTEDPQ